MSFRETAPVENRSRSLPTTLAAEAHRAEGQCLLQGQAPNNENSNNNNNNNNNRPKQSSTNLTDLIIINSVLVYLGAKLNSLKANDKVRT
jgi:hypothetical protein